MPVMILLDTERKSNCLLVSIVTLDTHIFYVLTANFFNLSPTTQLLNRPGRAEGIFGIIGSLLSENRWKGIQRQC